LRPGRPSVKSAPAVTKIAEEQHWLHWFMIHIASSFFIAVFRRDVLFHLEAHCKSVGHKAANFHESRLLKPGPSFILIVISIASLAGHQGLVAQRHDQC
jgi:cytochrome c oxidase subunit 2